MTDNPAAALANKRWAKLKTAKARRAATAPARAANKKISKRKRAAAAAKISPEAAKARAIKAWETKRKNAESAG